MELPKTYEPQKTEQHIYELWEKSGLFNPDKLKGKPFTILMPPPNANDPLHIGHAVFVTLQDIMTRHARMKGRKALWVPGMDHAGFETQVVYEKKLEKQGRSRFDMTREQFYQEVWDYTQKNRDIVRNQLKKLGASCDWSRETFTLDKKIIDTVYQTFKAMFDQGLAYRAERLVNYCTKHRTAFSELEIKREERKDPLYYIAYGPLTIATVRTETKYGTVALMVHPKDKRYQQYVGKEFPVDTMLNKKGVIKVIADESVDPEFGTGVVTVTPAHDFVDFEVWQRHQSEIPPPLQVIGKDGKLNEHAGPYAGLKVAEARQKSAQDMQAKGLIAKIDQEYVHHVALCYKCSNVIEPMLMSQWFLRMAPLAAPAREAVKKKRITIIPSHQEKVFFHWMKNLKDWNISRQNWWGIAIPAWQCASCSSWTVTQGKEPKTCSTCKGDSLKRDPDVFDTWFSSGQWPFAVLGFPKGKDFKTFYPTQVMETGYDILFFWVARMIMLGLYQTKQIPFQTVYLHGLVRDKDRQKMSKSKGNVIEPLGVAEIYGTDALRMALTVGNMPGQDTAISEDKIRGYRNFVNKLWNISRFILMSTQDFKQSSRATLSSKDKKILKDFAKVSKKATALLDDLKFSHSAELLYHYVWHELADKILEESKPVLQNPKQKKARQKVLLSVLKDCLILLHPFIPFVTEEIYQKLPAKKGKKLLMAESWPV